ncbi:MAG: YggS family pyridoxal phosphate-dependent enzyme [Bacteroidales bacterium]|nr:YggS family pyridoxal phosphate-dependent enzyme [Candidatus Sodaliphilus fimicaballi]
MSISNNIKEIEAQLPQGVRLVAVSKFHPVEALEQAYKAGQRVFGESRAQELVVKVPQLPNDIEWHFIGHLQTNKARQVVQYVNVIESVDSLKLLRLIDAEAARADRTIDVLLQLHVAQEEAKSGFLPKELLECAAKGELDGLTNTRICGLMAMATFTDDEEQIDSEFATVKETFDALKGGAMSGNSNFKEISMGMSDDWHIAVKHGSTLVRIGTAIFGAREY